MTHSLTHSLSAKALGKLPVGTETEEGEEMTGKKFKFQNTAAMLTYATHIPKEEYMLWLKKKMKRAFKFLRMAHEAPDHSEEGEEGSAKTPYEHTHVVFRLEQRFVTENARFFDWEGIHPHIMNIDCRKPKAWSNRVEYLAKEDPANEDLLAKKSCVTRIWECRDLKQALVECAGKPGDVSGVIAAWNQRPATYVWEMEWKLRIFQKMIMDIVAIDKRPDGRSIHWWWEKEGNIGKTYLAKYMMMNWPEYYYVVQGGMAQRDFATIVAGALENGWNGHCMLFCLTRSQEDHEGFYGNLESVCDGMVTATKYAGRTKVWAATHVVVLANWLPQMYQKDKKTGEATDKLTLSEDRWKIHNIKKEELESVPNEDPLVGAVHPAGGLTLKTPLGDDIGVEPAAHAASPMGMRETVMSLNL